MADVTGLRAWRYALPACAEATALLSPPYDVLSPAEVDALRARSPHNAAHVDVVTHDDYAGAGARVRAWQSSGVLVRDPRPAITLVEQRFDGPDGQPTIRRGLIAGVALEPFERGVILAHERTLSGPKRDRLRLFEASGLTASQVFGVYPAGDDDALAALWAGVTPFEAGAPAPTAGPTPLFVARSDDGVTHRVWRVDDPAAIAAVSRAFAERPILIADGHHRYETHLALAAAQRERLGRYDVPAGRVAMYLAALDDPGTRVYPIHRLVRDLPAFERAALVHSLGVDFEVSPASGGAEAVEAERVRRGGAFALLFADGSGVVCRPLRDPPADDPDPLARSPLTWLHRDVLERRCGVTAEALASERYVDYVKGTPALDGKVAAPGACFGVLLPPADLSLVLAAARQGVRMPQKSTWFFPKVASGVVFSPLSDDS